MTRKLLAVLVVGAAAAVAPGTAGATTTHRATGNLAALSCPTASLCYAAGANGRTAVFDTLRGGRQVKSQRVRGAESFIGLSCPTSSFCEMTANSPRGLGGVMSFSHGRFSRLTQLRWSPWQVSCPRADQCVIAGFAFAPGATLEAAGVVRGRVGRAHTHRLGRPFTSTAIYGLSCASLSSCEEVGTADYHAGIGFVYAKVGRGAVISGVHTSASNSAPTLDDGIACPATSSPCLMGASDQTGFLLFSVRVGGTIHQVASPDLIPNRISCHGRQLCTMSGTGNAAVPGIQSYDNGRLSSEQTFPNLESVGLGFDFDGVARLSPSAWIAIATSAGSTFSDVISGTP